MTTDLMEVYAIEPGDTVILRGEFFHVVDTDYSEENEDIHILTVVDDEGRRREIKAPGRSQIQIVCDEYV